MRRRSSAVPHSLLVVDSSCGHNWCLCLLQMGQSWRMWWTVCSASLQSQSAESTMPVRFRCVRRSQCPVRNLNIVVCSCLVRRLSGSVQKTNWGCYFKVCRNVASPEKLISAPANLASVLCEMSNRFCVHSICVHVIVLMMMTLVVMMVTIVMMLKCNDDNDCCKQQYGHCHHKLQLYN